MKETKETTEFGVVECVHCDRVFELDDHRSVPEGNWSREQCPHCSEEVLVRWEIVIMFTAQELPEGIDA